MLRGEIDAEFDQKRAKALEERFRAESEGNAFLMDSIDALGSAATSTFAGMLSGTMSLTDAMKNFASTILNQAVGALVDIGMQTIKNKLIEEAAIESIKVEKIGAVAAETSAVIAGTAATTTATVAAAGTTAVAAAPAAALTSTFSFGGAALAGGAALLATIALAKSASGREHGGPVSAGKMYQVGEGGKPEIFSSGGKNFMIPGDNGQVTSNKDAFGGGGPGGGSVNNFNFITDPNIAIEQGPVTQNNQGGQDSEFVIRVIAGDLAQHGSATNRALQSTNSVNDRLAGKRRG